MLVASPKGTEKPANDPDSALGKAIANRFADMPADDRLWQNSNRAKIVAKEEADKLGNKEPRRKQRGIADSE